MVSSAVTLPTSQCIGRYPALFSMNAPLTILKVQAKIRWLVKIKQPRQIWATGSPVRKCMAYLSDRCPHVFSSAAFTSSILL
jgi:hypothetical protein